VMVERALDVRFFVHVEQVQSASVDGPAHAAREVAEFLRKAWVHPTTWRRRFSNSAVEERMLPNVG